MSAIDARVKIHDFRGKRMMQWLVENIKWIFSGVGVTALAGLVALVSRKSGSTAGNTAAGIHITNVNTAHSSGTPISAFRTDPIAARDPHADNKARVRILFIDDDTRFRVVRILKTAGWVYTNIVRDVKATEAPEIQEANILFVDVQGVGKALGFANEGLGLALAIKNKYPKKKVVIYSAQTSGERFDEALRKADDFLAKNAEPYEFVNVVERMADDL
jgi:hypothetical protein